MNLTNYHSHCSYCDGKAPLEDFIKEAIKQGFTSYGISSHAPLPFQTTWTMNWEDIPAYLDEFNVLKSTYESQIELYVGMEIDYLDEKHNPSISTFQQLPLDYKIGSVHLLQDKFGEIVDIDCSSEKYRALVNERFEGDIEYVVKLYYDRLRQMVSLGGFDILGHADKMHYNAACYRPGLLEENWYNALMQEYFLLVASKGYIVEINTKAFLQLGTFYPNEKYFILLKKLNIPVQVNSDAHFPQKINDGRPEALSALKAIGYNNVMELHNGKWQEIPIWDYP